MISISSWTLRPLFLLSIHFLTAFSSTCYFPDGSIASDTPCTNSTASACCAADAYCLDNGLCITAMILSRGSCTDQTWKASECASYCQNVVPSGGKGMAPCSSTLWSCDYGTCSQDNFSVPDGNIVLRPYQASSLGVDLPATTVTVASLGPSSASQTLTPSSGTTPTNSVSGQTGSAACTSSSTSNSEVIGVGVGVGVTLGIALIALLVLFYRERRRNARMQQSQNSLSGIDYPNRNNTMSEKGSLGQDGRRTTLAELRGDGHGYELPGGNLHEMGVTNGR